MLVTPPLSLPYMGGEGLSPTYLQALPYPQALPSLVGEGQGWGQYSYNPYMLSDNSKNTLQRYTFFIIFRLYRFLFFLPIIRNLQ